jgi:hypothetical protein
VLLLELSKSFPLNLPTFWRGILQLPGGLWRHTGWGLKSRGDSAGSLST